MKTNENKVTGMRALAIGLGAFIGFLGISTVKALGLGMTLSNGIMSSIPEALGRMACVLAVCGVYYLVTKNNK